MQYRIPFSEAPKHVRWSCAASPSEVGSRTGQSLLRSMAGNEAIHPPQVDGPEVEAQRQSDQRDRAAAERITHMVELQQSILERLEELEQRRRQSLEEMQRLAIEIGAAVASRIVHDKVEAGELRFTELVEAAVERFDRNLALSVYLNPTDLQHWQDTLEHQTIPALAPTLIRLIGDRNLSRGGCRIDNGSFSLLFDWESQLTEIREHLTRSLHDTEIERRQDTPKDRKLGRFPDRREIA